MLNETLFSELVEASRDLPGNRWAVGGNAPVMAGRMAAEGCDVLLGGSFSPDFTDVLSQHITGANTRTLVHTQCIYRSHFYLHKPFPISPSCFYGLLICSNHFCSVQPSVCLLVLFTSMLLCLTCLFSSQWQVTSSKSLTSI